MTVFVPESAWIAARVIPIDGTHNFRDVGGHRAGDGRRVAEGRLYRSDALHGLGEIGRASLETLGIRRVVDLRSVQERAALPDAVGAATVIANPIFDDPASASMPTSLLEVYRMIIEARGPQLACAVRMLAEPAALPAVVHCAAGKDRTGIVIALVLLSLGVADEAVVADYAATAHLLTPEFRTALGASAAAEEALLRADPGDMFEVLTLLRERFGGARAYLGANGVTDRELEALDAALTVPDED